MSTKNDLEKVWNLIKRSEFGQLGFLDEKGEQNIRTTWVTYHKGLKSHYISSNTSSLHVQCLLKNNKACLYFSDYKKFEGVCLKGKVIVHSDHETKSALWSDNSLIYYPKGVDDPDYSVIEFIPESARYYGEMKNIDLTKEDFEQSDFGDTIKNYF